MRELNIWEKGPGEEIWCGTVAFEWKIRKMVWVFYGAWLIMSPVGGKKKQRN